MSNLKPTDKITTFSKLLSNSYKGDKKLNEIDGLQMDKSLSGNRAQVYTDANGKAYVVHRGTQGIQDIWTDMKLAFGDKSGKRFKYAKEIEDKAVKKYGAENITTLGHSLGASVAEKVGKDTAQVVTLNKPVNINDMVSYKVPKNQFDFKTQNDPVSFLRQFQGGQKATNIESKSYNPLKEHTTSTLLRLNDA